MNVEVFPAERAAAPRLDGARTAAYFGGHIVLGLVTASLGPTLAGLAARVGVAAEALGFLFSARAVGYLLGSLVSGKVYDGAPGHRILAAGVAALAGLFLSIPLATSPFSLAALFLLVGAAQGFVDVGNNTLISWVHGEKVGPFMSALHCFFGVGALLSPMIAAKGGGVGPAYALLAATIAPSAILFAVVSSPSPRKATAEAEGSPDKPLLVALLAALFFFYQGAEVGFGGWIFTYASAVGLSKEAASTLTSVFWSAFTAGRVLTIPLSLRVAPRRLLAADFALALAGLAVILLLPGSRAALFSGVALVGLSLASVFPMAISLAGREMRLSGSVTSRLLVGASAGSMVLPWLVGRAFAFGPRGPMLAVLGDLAVAAGMVWLVSKNIHQGRAST